MKKILLLVLALKEVISALKIKEDLQLAIVNVCIREILRRIDIDLPPESFNVQITTTPQPLPERQPDGTVFTLMPSFKELASEDAIALYGGQNYAGRTNVIAIARPHILTEN